MVFIVIELLNKSIKNLKENKSDNSTLKIKQYLSLNKTQEKPLKNNPIIPDLNENKTKFEIFLFRIHEILFKKTVLITFILALFVIYLIIGMEIALSILILIFMVYFLTEYYPKIKLTNKYSDITNELPYALRHMSTELKSGKGLHDTLIVISKNDYGSLSEEFNRVLEEIKYGKSTEESLTDLSKRVNSKGLSRAIQQINGTLKVGGNLSSNLNIIAEDVSFDMQIQLKEYSQKLNGFILIYTFLAILGPVILLIMIMAASTVMGDIIPSNVLLILYLFFFPMIVIFMGLLIKKLEPNL